jgi:Fe-S cluster assembly protein SufD
MANELKNKINEYFRAAKTDDMPSYIIDAKQSALAEFAKIGFPTQKMEEWKYTGVKFLDQIDFSIAPKCDENQIKNIKIEDFLLKEIKENYIVTVNGYFSESLSKFNHADEGLIICGLREAISKYPELIAENLGKYSSIANTPFRLLNSAMYQDGVFIYAPKKFKADGVFHIVHLIDSSKKAYLSSPRTLIVADKSAEIKIIESAHNYGDYAGFTNLVTEVIGLENSNIDYYKLQNDNKASYYVGSTDVELKQDSSFHNATISLDGKFVRNNLNVALDGENINANFHGFFYATKDNLIDNHTYVDHLKPNCVSDEVYKGIIDGKSVGVFNGKIMVRPDAQKTNAYQSNKNILISDDAKIYTKPQLEIYADDVKCSHGATTGYLDAESLFYLKSRGIGENKAKALLLNAFASDVFDKIKISALCDEVKSLTAKRLNIDDDAYFCKLI